MLKTKSANNWKCCTLVPKTKTDKKEARESIRCVLNAFEMHMSLIMHKGKVGAVGMTNKVTMGYYLIKWLSKPHTLQEDTGGMSGMIPAETMVVDALYFNRVHHTQHWYTPSAETMVTEVKHVLQICLQVQPISETNALPLACVRAESLDHEVIMEEVSKRDRLEYEDDRDDDGKSKKESDEESEESKSDEESE